MRDPLMPATTASTARPQNPFRRGNRTANLRYADPRYQQRRRGGNKTAVTTIVFGVVLCAVTFVSLLQNSPGSSSETLATNVLYLRNSNTDEETTIPVVTAPSEGNNELGTAGVDSNTGQEESFPADAREEDDTHQHMTTSREDEDDETMEAGGQDSADPATGDDATSHEDDQMNAITDDAENEEVADESLHDIKSEKLTVTEDQHEVIEEMVADESDIAEDTTDEDLQQSTESNEQIVVDAEDSSSTRNDEEPKKGTENSTQSQSIFGALPASAKEKLLHHAINAVPPIDNENDDVSIVKPHTNGSVTASVELLSLPDDNITIVPMDSDLNNSEAQASSDFHHESQANATVVEQVDQVTLEQTDVSNRTTSSEDLGDADNLIAVLDTDVTSDVQKTDEERVADSDVHQEGDIEIPDESVAEPDAAAVVQETKDSNAEPEKHVISSPKEFDSQILQNTFMRSVKTAVTEIPPPK